MLYKKYAFKQQVNCNDYCSMLYQSCYASSISPAHLKAYFATITAMISLITAAATIVPDTISASDGAKEDSAEAAIPVNTRETPE